MRASRFLLAWVLACDPGPPAPRSFRLENDSVIVVHPDGQVVLERGERVLTAIPPEFGPRLHTYSERTRGDLGIWEHIRSDEVTDELVPTGVPRLGDSGDVQIDYASETASATLAITSDGPDRTRFELALSSGEANSIAIPFRCDDDGSFHGFGEQYNDTDQRGEAFSLFVSEQGIGRTGAIPTLTGDAHTTYFPMPYWLDARGFGVLFTTDYRVIVDVCASDTGVAWIEVTDDSPVEWIVFHGPTSPSWRSTSSGVGP